MRNIGIQETRAVACIVLITGSIATAQAQSIQFPAGGPPVIAAPSISQVNGSGRPAMVVDSGTGRQFVASYDSSGRLVSLKSNRGRNAFDLRAIAYLPDGRIALVSFGNRYEIIFRNRNDGTQEIVDPLGGSIVRSQSSPGQFVNKSVTDPSGYLAPSLRRVEALFAIFGGARGLSTSSISVAQ
jgi:hypothetical protein